LPAGVTLASGGVLSGTPTTAATYSFTIKATDSTGDHIGTRAYSVTMAANVNHPPVANTDIASTTVCQTIGITPLTNDTDPDGDALSVVSVNGNGFTLLSSTLVQYQAPLAAGGYSGSYVVQDTHGAQATGTIDVNVGSGTCTIGGGGGGLQAASPTDPTTTTQLTDSTSARTTDPTTTTTDPTTPPQTDLTTPSPSGGE
jgi:large repetitive protein